MALLWMDGFDYLGGYADNTDVTTVMETLYGYDSRGSGARVWYTTQEPFGPSDYSPRACVGYDGSGNGLYKGFPDTQTIIVGSHIINRASLSGLSRVITFFDGETEQCGILINTDGSVSAMRGATVLGTSDPGKIVASAWAFIEVKATIGNSGGAMEIRVNGITVLSLTGVDTQISANASVDAIKLQTSAAGNGTAFDNLYICDTTGVANNDFLGPVRVIARMADADSSTENDWVALGAGSKYAEVDETQIDSDTSYIYTSTIGAEQRFTHANVSGLSVGTIFGVQQHVVARFDDIDPTTVKLTANDGTQSDGADTATQSAPRAVTRILETPPSGGSWDAAKVDACEFGVKHVG